MKYGIGSKFDGIGSKGDFTRATYVYERNMGRYGNELYTVDNKLDLKLGWLPMWLQRLIFRN